VAALSRRAYVAAGTVLSATVDTYGDGEWLPGEVRSMVPRLELAPSDTTARDWRRARANLRSGHVRPVDIWSYDAASKSN
jgi:hypothetical protein